MPAVQGVSVLCELSDIYRWHRLCLRIYGMLTWDINQQVEDLAAAAHSFVKRGGRAALSEILRDDMPVILALYAMDYLEKQSNNMPAVTREILLPCFSLSYSRLYASKLDDPLKHFLARMDWFLDGEKGDPGEALSHVLTTTLGDKIKNAAPVVEHLSKIVLPEMNRRMWVAWRSEFH